MKYTKKLLEQSTTAADQEHKAEALQPSRPQDDAARIEGKEGYTSAVDALKRACQNEVVHSEAEVRRILGLDLALNQA